MTPDCTAFQIVGQYFATLEGSSPDRVGRSPYGCRLGPVKKVAQTIKKHLSGIINAIVMKVDNGGAESINSRIKMIKVRSRGFRNKARFRNAIYFHLGGLDLYPAGIKKSCLPT
jgi:hypothetical protein